MVDLARGLEEEGWQVELACSAVGCSRSRLGGWAVPVHELVGRLVKRRFSLTYARRLRRLVRSGRYDLVHAHVYASEAAAALAVVGRAVPLVVTDHTEAPWRGPLARRVSRLVYHRAAAVIAVSTAIAELLEHQYGIDPGRVRRVIPVGRRSGTTLSATPRPPDLPAGPLVGCVGRLEPEKGVDILLRAFHQVRLTVPQASLLVVGGGGQSEALRRLADGLQIGARTHFLGHREDALDLLRWLDVLVVPSRSDGSPLVIHEAQEVGTPVIGSAVGGIPDRLAEGSAGLLVPPGDHQSLAEALTDVLTDPARRADLARAGRCNASRHSYRAMVAAVSALYAEVVSLKASDDVVPWPG